MGINLSNPENSAAVTDHAANYGLHTLVKRKSADETVNNSTTLQNDDDLVFALAANEVWMVQLLLLIDSSTVADIRFGWAYPSGCTIKWSGTDYYWGTTNTSAIPIQTNAVDIPGIGAGSVKGWWVAAIVINGSTAGNLNLQWCQATAEVSDTKLLANSCLVASKVS